MKSINQRTEKIKREPMAPTDRIIAAVSRFPLVIRKMQQDLFARGLQGGGFAIAIHHANIMKTLQESGTLSSSELGEILFVSKAQMSHSTEKLMKMGLVEKGPNIIDRRKVNISLTPKGQAVIQKIDKVLLDLIHERISNLSDDELEKLSESFDNIVEVFS